MRRRRILEWKGHAGSRDGPWKAELEQRGEVTTDVGDTERESPQEKESNRASARVLPKAAKRQRARDRAGGKGTPGSEGTACADGRKPPGRHSKRPGSGSSRPCPGSLRHKVALPGEQESGVRVCGATRTTLRGEGS